MKEQLVSQNFTFKKLCKNLGERDDVFTKVFHSLFDVALLFCPSVKIPAEIASTIFEQDIAINVLEAKERLESCVENVVALIKENSPGSYYKKYNDMRIAHYLLVFSAFYDSVRTLLPDKDYHIPLDEDYTLYIAEDALNHYAEKYKDTDTKTIDLGRILDCPHSLTFQIFYEEELEELYRMLTEEFLKFYYQILDEEKISSAVADVVSARIRAVPKLAKDVYQAQYFALKEKFSLFSEYSNTEEHRIMISKIDQLPQVMKKIEDDRLLDNTLKAHETLERYYKSQIRKKILYDGDDDEYDMLPTVEDSFIPQSYKSIVFRTDGKKRTLLGPDSTWENIEEKDDLSTYIGQTLGAPPFDRKPLIILGDPGGGKSTLSKMLAAKIFSQQYHVIVVRLREVNADEPVFAQIEQQIRRDISQSIAWSDILSGGNFGTKDMNRYREIKYISDRSEGTVGKNGILRQGFKTMNAKVRKDYKTLGKHKALLPVGYLAEGGKYIALLLTGKRKSSGTKQMFKEAAERKRIYSSLNLFK